METLEQPVHNAPPVGVTSETRVSRSRSTGRASNGTAGIAAGRVENSTTISAEAEGWMRQSRRISRRTMERLGVVSGMAYFPDAGRDLPAVGFRYPGGWKARSFPQKHFVAGKGFKLSFWNIESVVRTNPERVYIVEGEFDACALVEAGIDPGCVLSVPNGAKERPVDDPTEARGYDFVREALRDGLNRAKAIVWCGDSDGPGLVLRQDMARIFGGAKYHFVEWPEGCKDANDFLITDGGPALRDLVENGSLPWPVDGLYRISELPEPAPMTIWDPGFREWDKRVRLASRTLSIVTGHPGHGKTAMWAQIWFNVSQSFGIPVAVATFETRPKPHYRKTLRTLFHYKLEKEQTEKEIAEADRWIDSQYLFFVHPDNRPSIEWFLDMCEVAVIRHGVRVIQADPWNRMEAARRAGESETEYIGRCLRELHSFAQDMNCHIQILAHPAKMDGQRRGMPPGLEDISGSKNWENMCDQGFVVHRPSIFKDNKRQTGAVLYQKKARFEELGYPCKLAMDFDLDKGRYKAVDDLNDDALF